MSAKRQMLNAKCVVRHSVAFNAMAFSIWHLAIGLFGVAVLLTPSVAGAQSPSDACYQEIPNIAGGVEARCSYLGTCSATLDYPIRESQIISFLPQAARSVNCGGTDFCCYKRSASLCEQVAYRMERGHGTCETACGNSQISATSLSGGPGFEVCPQGYSCCVPRIAGDPGGLGAGCVDSTQFNGVSSACRTRAGTDEFDATGIPQWSTYLLGGDGDCSSGQRCYVKRGDDLCRAAVTKFLMESAAASNDAKAGSGDFGCFETSKCGTKRLPESAAFPGGACGAGQTCCTPEKETSGTGTGTRVSGSTGIPETLPDPLGGANIPTFIGSVIRTFAGIAGTIALVMFVYGGITLIMSGGEASKVKAGRDILLNASIGLILIFAAYTIVSAIIDAILAE